MSTDFIFESSALASRKSAARIRTKVEAALNLGPTTLNFTGVESISDSYADELLGVLVAKKPVVWIFQRLEIRGLQEPLAEILARAIRRRLLEQDNSTELLRQALAQKGQRIFSIDKFPRELLR